jgi:hypothetical protein
VFTIGHPARVGADLGEFFANARLRRDLSSCAKRYSCG